MDILQLQWEGFYFGIYVKEKVQEVWEALGLRLYDRGLCGVPGG